MCAILEEFIKLNYKKLKLSDELSRLIAQHHEAARTLMAHYDIQRELEHPLVEFARYVLIKGADEEKLRLICGIESELALKDKKIRFYTTI